MCSPGFEIAISKLRSINFAAQVVGHKPTKNNENIYSGNESSKNTKTFLPKLSETKSGH